jgi:hypothetical protein
MDVAHQLQQVLVTVTQDGLVAPLKQMADCSVAPVVQLRVAKLYPLHDLGKKDRSGFQKQVDVVGHQHISIERKAAALAVVLHSLEIAQSVSLILKNLPSLIAPDNDVIKGSFKLHSGFPSH